MRPGSAEDMNSHVLAICETQVRQTELISQVVPVSRQSPEERLISYSNILGSCAGWRDSLGSEQRRRKRRSDVGRLSGSSVPCTSGSVDHF
jgi:hypothetical protein